MLTMKYSALSIVCFFMISFAYCEDVVSYIFVKNDSSREVKSIITFPVKELSIPGGTDLMSLSIVDDKSELDSQVEDDNFDGRIDGSDILVFEVVLRPMETKALKVCCSSKKRSMSSENKVVISEDEQFYLITYPTIEAKFLKESGCLCDMRYRQKEISGFFRPDAIGLGINLSGVGSKHQSNAFDLKTDVQSGPVRTRVDFSGPTKQGMKPSAFLKGYFFVTAGGRIGFFAKVDFLDSTTLLNIASGAALLEKAYGEIYMFDGNSIVSVRPLNAWMQYVVNRSFAGVLDKKEGRGIAIAQGKNVFKSQKINVWGRQRSPKREHFSLGVVATPPMENFWTIHQGESVDMSYSFLFYEDSCEMEKAVCNVTETPEVYNMISFVEFLKTENDSMTGFVGDYNKQFGKNLSVFPVGVDSNFFKQGEGSGLAKVTAAMAMKKKLDSAKADFENIMDKDLADHKNTLCRLLVSLDKDNLFANPAMVEKDGATMYGALSRLSYVPTDKRLIYKMKSLKHFSEGVRKAGAVREKTLRADMPEVKQCLLMLGVTSGGYPTMAEVLKTLRIKYLTNCELSPFALQSGNAGPLLDYCQNNGLKVFTLQQDDKVKEYADAFKKDFLAGIEFKDGKPVYTEKKTEPDGVKQYRQLFQNFVSKYKDAEAIMGWDHGGESGRIWYRDIHPSETRLFRQYLQDKYKTVDRLNSVWSLDGVPCKYKDFGEIPALIKFRLEDWKENKTSWRVADWRYYQKRMQAACMIWNTSIIRDIDKIHPIMMVDDHGMYPTPFRSIDPYFDAEAEYLATGTDLYPASWGKHPWFQMITRIDSRRSAKHGADVWIGELGHWNGEKPNHNSCVYPEELREWVYTVFVHGAKLLGFFVWQAGSGAWDLLCPDETPYETSIELGKMICEAENYPFLWRAKPERNVALYYPRLSAFLGRSSEGEMAGLHKLLTELGYGVDIIDSEHIGNNGLKNYKLLVIPPSPVIEENVVGKISEYLTGGGVVMAPCNTGRTNEWGNENKAEFTRLTAGAAVHGNTNFVSLKSGKGTAIFVKEKLGWEYWQNESAKAEIRKDLLSSLLAQGIFPPACPDSDNVETPIIADGDKKYLVAINHLPKKIDLGITIYDTTISDLPGEIYDLITLEKARVQKTGKFQHITLSLPPLNVGVFDIGGGSRGNKRFQ